MNESAVSIIRAVLTALQAIGTVAILYVLFIEKPDKKSKTVGIILIIASIACVLKIIIPVPNKEIGDSEIIPAAIGATVGIWLAVQELKPNKTKKG